MNDRTPSPRTPRPQLRLSGLALTLLAALCGSASAQTAPEPTDSAAPHQPDTIVMSTFEVDAVHDKGYLASNSISASRINTPIADLPFSVSAITSQFIKDTGAIDLNSIVSYSAGVRNGSGAFLGGNNVFVIRGFSQTPEHDGFFESAQGNNFIDPVNVERVEVVKGPASLLYGTISPGGTVNYITKHASETPFVDLSYSGGSYNFSRATIDLNQPLIPGVLLFRLNAAWQTNFEYVKPSHEVTTALDPTLTWNVTKKLSLKSSFQYFNLSGTPAINQIPQVEVSTPQSIVNALNPALGYPGTSALLVNKTSVDYPLGYNDSSDPGSLSLLGAWPKRQNYEASTDWYRATLITFNQEADVTLGEHWVARANFNYNSNQTKQKITGVSTFDTAPANSLVYNATSGLWSVSPAWNALTPAQQTQSALNYVAQVTANPAAVYASGQPLIDPRRQRYLENFGFDNVIQAEASGDYKLSWATLRPLVGVFYDANHATNINLQNAGNAAVPWFRAWDANPSSPTYYENDNTDFATTNLSSLTADQLGFTTDHAAYAILNSSFFDGRLLLTGGARYNYTHSVATNYLSTAAPTSAHFSDTTPEVGLGFKVLPDLMVYGSYSTSYTPPSSAILTTISTVNGLPVSLPTGVASPTTGTGYEAGFKTSFLSGRISSTVSLYQIDQDDVVQSVSQVVSGYSVTTTLQGTKIRSRGAEAEITWSPADNLQVFASAAEDDVRYSAEPLGYAYYLGTHPQYTSKTLANLWGRYTLKATPAKGLWVGGGFQYRSKSIANNNNEAFYVPDVTLWNSVVGYDWTWDRRKFSLQVHWENMTNTGDYITIYERGLPERVLATLDVRF